MRSYIVVEILTDVNDVPNVICGLRREKPNKKCFIKFISNLCLMSLKDKSIIRVYRLRNRPPYFRSVISICCGAIVSKYES